MKFLNIVVLTAVGLASAAVAAPAPEVPTAPTVTINLTFPTKTAVMIEKRAKKSTSCTSTKTTTTSCTSTKKTTTSCTKTPKVKTTTSCTSSKTTTIPKVQIAKVAAAATSKTTTTTVCRTTITVPFPSMDSGAYTIYASTTYFTKRVECATGCQLMVQTAANTLPIPTKTVTAALTTRTLHACSPTSEAKKWRA
ncbi:uncharacterized protein DFL_001531 [Arthrobotrys flagrans]|uniref:Uncharacterized protein n=1 Tax=Arthrobotrys flagrans TaxID=97331 RepID=A0A437A7W6_ARTFL|nr:hypothetical protein DFL_001531 [Arthrobotrys flagrans]